MIVVYPIGVPLFILVLLHLQRQKIQRVMWVKKALTVSETKGPERGEQALQDISDKAEREHLTLLFKDFNSESAKIRKDARARRQQALPRESANQDNEDEVSIERIAHRDSTSPRRSSDATFSREARLVASQLKSSVTLADPNERGVSKVLLSMSHIFDKFEPETYWYGVYLMTVRLLETSMLVFFKKRTTKASVATAVAVVSLTIAQKYKPWLRDSDDQVRG